MHSELLKRAAERLGGSETLRSFLGASDVQMAFWLKGSARLPDELFLKVVDVLHFTRAECLRVVLDAALASAMKATGSPLGNVQLAKPDGLHIAAHRGFSQPFLDYFAVVAGEDCACGTAMAQARRIVVRDVADDPIFRRRVSRQVMLQAGARSVQSTPVVSSGGMLLGMLSTHDHEARAITPRQGWQLDWIAQHIGRTLESTDTT